MIRLACTKCKTVLTMDDAFAGGVCRCQHCGTIQTVPANLAGNAEQGGAGKAAAGGASSTKALYQTKTRTSGRGLDALADAVATSSGLTGSGLRSGRLQKPESPAAAGSSKKLLLILIAAGIVIVALAATVVYLAVFKGSPTPTGTAGGQKTPVAGKTNTGQSGSNDQPATGAKAVFLGLDLSNESSVVFLFDHGSTTGEGSRFDFLKEACLRSLQTFGSARRFQVIFWNNGTSKNDKAFPETGLAVATPEKIKACRTMFDDVYASGHCKIDSALKTALEKDPSAIVIATGASQDDDFAQAVLSMRKKSTCRIHCFTLVLDEACPAMQKIAQQTGGEYRNVSMGTLSGVQ